MYLQSNYCGLNEWKEETDASDFRFSDDRKMMKGSKKQRGRNISKMRKPFECDKCDRSYTHSNHLQQHKKWECGKPPRFKCDLCSYRSIRSSNLRDHIDRYHLSANKS